MSRDINRILNPGEEQTVQARGDFVYCKVATLPIHVSMDMQVVEMVAGDKLRQPSRFTDFKIENRSTDTVVFVTLVVGDGDYQSQIIRGEVAVRPRLLTEDGTLREDSRYWLSLFIRPEPGYSPQTYSYADIVKSWTGLNAPEDGGYGNQAMEWDPVNGVWLLRKGDGTWFEYSAEWGFLRTQAGPANDGFLQGEFALDDGAAYCWYVDGYGKLFYAARTDSGAGTEITSTNPSGQDFDDEVSIFVVGDYLCLWAANTQTIYRVPLVEARSPGVNWKTWLTGLSGSSGNMVYDGRRYLHNVSTQTTRCDTYDLQADDPSATAFQSTSVGYIPIAAGYRGGLLYKLKDTDQVDATWPLEGPDTISVKAVADPAACTNTAGMIRRDDFAFTLADVSATQGTLGSLNVSGEVIRAALALYAGDVDAPADYLDHVYAVRANTGIGHGKQSVQANQTFAAAGVADDFRMTIPGAIHIQVDALLFDN